MCFNPQVSIATFLFSLVICLAIYFQTESAEKKALALFFVFVSLMQIVEAILWVSIDKNTINKTTSIFGFWLNFMQPVVLMLLCEQFGLISHFNRDFMYVALLLYLSFCIFKFTNLVRNSDFISGVNDQNHLEWSWSGIRNDEQKLQLGSTGYQFYIIFQLIVIFSYFQQSALGMSIFAVSYFLLFISFQYFSQNISELWCFFANFVPLMLLF